MMSLIIQYKGDEDDRFTTRIDKANLRQSKQTGAGLSTAFTDIVTAGLAANTLISLTSIWASGNSQDKIFDYLSVGVSLAATILNDAVSRSVRKSIRINDSKAKITNDILDVISFLNEKTTGRKLTSAEFNQSKQIAKASERTAARKNLKSSAAGAGASLGVGLGLQAATSFLSGLKTNAANQRQQINNQFKARLNGVATTGAF